MSKIEAEKSCWLRSFLTELGIVEPASVAELGEDHRGVIEACRNGKIAQAMLRGSMLNDERVSGQVGAASDKRQFSFSGPAIARSRAALIEPERSGRCHRGMPAGRCTPAIASRRHYGSVDRRECRHSNGAPGGRFRSQGRSRGKLELSWRS